MILLNEIAVRNNILYIQSFTSKVLNRITIFYSPRLISCGHVIEIPSCTADPTEITLKPGSNFISLVTADKN